MTFAALDRLLAILVIALAGTGLVTLRMGSPGDAWLFALHGVLGGALAVAVGWKLARSLPKAVRAGRWLRVAFGLVVSAATIAALVGGFAWVVGGRLLSLGPWTILTLHSWVGLALVPLILVHLLPKRWRLLVPRAADAGAAVARPQAAAPGLSRRLFVVAGGLTLASIAIFGAAQLADRLSGGVRRFTGSRWLPPGVPPPTTFYGEATPHIDSVAWRLRVHGKVRQELSLSLRELASLGEIDRSAILDCTSGWAMDAAWRGVPLRAVLDAAGWKASGRRVFIRATTGWAASLTRSDVDRALLATGVAGGPLPVANGAPCRLVVPDRRGLDWVKWVAEIEVA